MLREALQEVVGRAVGASAGAGWRAVVGGGAGCVSYGLGEKQELLLEMWAAGEGDSTVLGADAKGAAAPAMLRFQTGWQSCNW